MQRVEGTIVDVVNRRCFSGTVVVDGGRIASVEPASTTTETMSVSETVSPAKPRNGDLPTRYILPGFVDSHIHIESTMLVPSEFARMAVRHGTVATVSDPHEIANVCGLDGVEFMIENARTVPLKISFGAPSCVPATRYETAGAELDTAAVTSLLDRPDILYLSEMMDWPGVLSGAPAVTAKISAAIERGKPVDGHAPGLRGDDARRYADAGISTDHECFSKAEAADKLAAGMHIAIREGSAARNYDALISLLAEAPGRIMFCSDDKHPDELLAGHMNVLASRTLAAGYNLFDTLHAFCVLPVRHYGLDVGLLQPGDPADFVVVEDLDSMTVEQTWIDGEPVYDSGTVRFERPTVVPINRFCAEPRSPADFFVDPQRNAPEATAAGHATGPAGVEAGEPAADPATATGYATAPADGETADPACAFTADPLGVEAVDPAGGEAAARYPVILVKDGELITGGAWESLSPTGIDGASRKNVAADLTRDILKIAVVNRYREAPAAVGFVRGFGLRRGAIASSVAHDSHNIIAVGTDETQLCEAVNMVIAERGGIAAVADQQRRILPLPVAGLMSVRPGDEVAADYRSLCALAREMGCRLHSPYMLLSFMALLVIPRFKIGDRGMFDGERFEFI